MQKMKSTGLLFSLALLIGITSCKTSSKSSSEATAPVVIDPLELLTVSYDSPWMDISIEKKQITKIKTQHHFKESNFSSVPDSISTQTLKDREMLSDSILNEMQKLLDDKKFWELEDNYGAPEGQRFYPYTITAKKDTLTKTVVFRSNPSYGLAPDAFREVEKFLTELE